MVLHPRHYPWSSYSINAEGKQSDLITPNEQYLRLGVTGDLRRDAYQGLFKAHMDTNVIDDIRSSTNGNYVLGNERFKNEILAILNRRVVPGKAGRPVRLF